MIQQKRCYCLISHFVSFFVINFTIDYCDAKKCLVWEMRLNERHRHYGGMISIEKKKVVKYKFQFQIEIWVVNLNLDLVHCSFSLFKLTSTHCFCDHQINHWTFRFLWEIFRFYCVFHHFYIVFLHWFFFCLSRESRLIFLS